MHPVFLQAVVDDKVRRARGAAAGAARRHPEPPRAFEEESIVLRLCRVHDDEALTRLAQLEGRTLPAGSFVVAELGGSIVAALPLGGGAPLADPFRPTAEIVPLLRLRAAQIANAQGASRSRLRVLGRLASRG